MRRASDHLGMTYISIVISCTDRNVANANPPLLFLPELPLNRGKMQDFIALVQIYGCVKLRNSDDSTNVAFVIDALWLTSGY